MLLDAALWWTGLLTWLCLGIVGASVVIDKSLDRIAAAYNLKRDLVVSQFEIGRR